MRLPPLNALRAFEAAARLGGFARAAEELNVSPGAISRHVKLLEEHFGTPLFERLAQGIKPTETALAMLPKITAAFEMIAAAVNEAPGLAGKLKIIATPTFANRVLVPRLPDFNASWPEIAISVSLLLADLDGLDMAAHDCAVATFHDPAWPAGVRAERLRAEALTPLCAPTLVRPRAMPLRPGDLRDLTLLRIAACPWDWPNWLEQNGLLGSVQHSQGPVIETGELAIRAAVEGVGVVLMDRYLVQEELQAGDLLDLFPETKPIDNGYFFVCAESRW
jgi:DNA-binding transcriptional LysR family regulator